jgi:hypothetical protein
MHHKDFLHILWQQEETHDQAFFYGGIYEHSGCEVCQIQFNPLAPEDF